MNLPKRFMERMKVLLNDEYEDFIKAFEQDEWKALRINKKMFKENGRDNLPFSLRRVPWEETGYYYKEEETPGRHPYHHAGVYYIQEPSAMAPAAFLCQDGIGEDEVVLDLCAAPGGKSTQIASYMNGKGILYSNEINRKRAEILSENIERMGIGNAIVINEAPEELSPFFNEYFDRICVDAPCSGEGMFRKNDEAVEEWSEENVIMCANRQDGILDEADKMLKKGGKMVYSTCTFAEEEDEGTIKRFLSRHSNYEIVDVKIEEGMNKSEYGIRLFPHKIQGEGHFVCVLQKSGEKEQSLNKARNKEIKSLSEKEIKAYRDFEREFLKERLEGCFTIFKESLYLLPEGVTDFKGLRVLRPGLCLGEIKKDRFEPSHSLAQFLTKDMVKDSHITNLASSSKEIEAYLHGEAFVVNEEGKDKGFHLITVDGFSTGLGKLSNGQMKNHYPKGLRTKY